MFAATLDHGRLLKSSTNRALATPTSSSQPPGSFSTPQHAGLCLSSGIVQLTAGFSLWNGHTYGRVLGIIAGGLGAIGALLSIGGTNPWWSLCVFALCIYIVHGIVVYGEDEEAARAGVR